MNQKLSSDFLLFVFYEDYYIIVLCKSFNFISFSNFYNYNSYIISYRINSYISLLCFLIQVTNTENKQPKAGTITISAIIYI